MYLDKSGRIEISTGGDLPHWHQAGVIQFVTFRLKDSLPQEVIRDLSEEFLKGDISKNCDKRTKLLIASLEEKLLDNGYGKCVLRKPEIREILRNVLHHDDGSKYDLIAYVIMPNHIHLLYIPFEKSAEKFAGEIKRISSRMINRYLNTSGNLWQSESFDRMVRSKQDLLDYIEYIRQNPANLKSDEYDLYISPHIENM